MTPLNEPDAAALKAIVREAIDVTPGVGAFFKRDFLVRHGFRAVVFEGDFRDAEQAVSRLCRDRAIANVRCLSLDEQSSVPAFRFEPAHEDLKLVRELYHTPSYVIQDDPPTLMIVSDSDYYWGFAGAPQTVATVAAGNSHLRQTRADIRAFLASDDAHGQRIGAMLGTFHDVCDSVAATVA